MYRINETATGFDLAEMLSGENGIFEATSPSGDKFQVISRAGHSISNLRGWTTNAQGQNVPLWRVRKVGELRSEQQTG